MQINKKVAIVQSCYIPWKGYFDLINRVDEFILYDDMQFTRRDWRNRNIIKTAQGPLWLTIPVEVKGQYFQNINETKISDKQWAKKHWKSISLNYARAAYYKQYSKFFEDLYSECAEETYISQINYKFIDNINQLLGIKTKLSWSTDYEVDNSLTKTDRLLALCQKAEATYYLSGPSAKQYMQEDLFQTAGITIDYIDYSTYPPYPQLFGSFDHTVTILDLLFNTGPVAPTFIFSSR